MTTRISGSEVKKAFKRQDIFSRPYTPCEVCGKDTHLVNINGKLYLDPICDCKGKSPVTELGWDGLAEKINKTRSAKKRQALLDTIGL